MDKQPLVTVITPAYNCAAFVEETIESVLSQDYSKIEYYISDDGSSDNTWELLSKYDGRLILERHPNIGEQRTFNRLISKIKGRYFMFVNADDPLLPGAISTLVNFMEQNPTVVCVYPDWVAINEDGSFRIHVQSREYDFKYMVRHHMCLPSVGSMFRSRYIGYRDTSFKWLGDFDFWLRLGLAGDMARVPITLATWRHRKGQASEGKNDERAQEHIRIMQKFYSLPNITPELLALKREAVCWSYLVAAGVSKSKRQIISYIYRGLKSYPWVLFKLEFYDAVLKRVYYILRR